MLLLRQELAESLISIINTLMECSVETVSLMSLPKVLERWFTWPRRRSLLISHRMCFLVMNRFFVEALNTCRTNLTPNNRLKYRRPRPSIWIWLILAQNLLSTQLTTVYLIAIMNRAEQAEEFTLSLIRWLWGTLRMIIDLIQLRGEESISAKAVTL
jgi:hypothetical protein